MRPVSRTVLDLGRADLFGCTKINAANMLMPMQSSISVYVSMATAAPRYAQRSQPNQFLIFARFALRHSANP